MRLREAVCFKTISSRQAETALKNHVFLIVAKDNEKTVGMTRLISDGAYIAVLADVIILPEYQNQGIGKVMIGKALEHIKNSNPKELTIGTILCFDSIFIMLINNLVFDETQTWLLFIQLITALSGIALIAIGIQKRKKQKEINA
jgi:GNAT superfamily N-acetyltransferase